jgi:pilus assembly protein Flp/PilA
LIFSTRKISSSKKIHEEARMAWRIISHLFRKEEGQTLSEYALILILIAIVAIVAVTLLGTQLAAMFTQVANAF